MDKKSDQGEESNEVEEVLLTDPDEDSLDESSDEDEELAVEDESQIQAPLTEEEIQELVDELLEVESKAAEAQEALEAESLEKVEREVREELEEKLQGDDLEKAVVDEMQTLKETWEATLDDLEAQSAELLEQLDGAGIDLPSIYKSIESRAPSECCTEVWRRRTHWVGSEVASDAVESIRSAEKHLETLRPVRRRHGKVLEEGASGYLGKKVSSTHSSSASAENNGVDWGSFNKLFSHQSSKDGIAFGSEQWASVYLASTPQQAAAIGLKFPGVDEVEEIDEIDDNPSDPFMADAVAHEKELDLTEEQRKNYRKVKEEDDMTVDKKLQQHLKRRRRKKRKLLTALGKSSDVGHVKVQDLPENTCNGVGDLKAFVPDRYVPFNDHIMGEKKCENDSLEVSLGSKHLRACDEVEREAKRSRTISLDSDDEAQLSMDESNVIGYNDSLMEMQHRDQEGDHEYKLENYNFHCTACGKGINDVHQHPLLKVIICRECKCAVEAKMSRKESDCSEDFCGWCANSDKLINCRSCLKLFCLACVKRNIGVECSSEAKSYGWKCCCCSPNLLQELNIELEQAMQSKSSTSSSSESDSNASDDYIGVSISTKKKKKIRRILDDTELAEETKRERTLEKERLERLESRKIIACTSDGSVHEGAEGSVLGDALTGYIVNAEWKTDDGIVRLPPSISAKLKSHQVQGIRFMWQNTIESMKKIKAGHKGMGCILAHTMGLGKTLQVIAFLYAVMRSVDVGLRRALIVTPVNVLHNWLQEFKKWQPTELKPLRVYLLGDKPREQRVELLTKWRSKGGVLLIGYDAFRNLCFGKNVKNQQTAKEICLALQEGPDILVCDEAHKIKNDNAEITQALKLVKCQRRIALTGSPLQNNVMEYFCMVNFVRKGLLGEVHEFRNRFQNPIENGQHANSNAEDVRIMNERLYIMQRELRGVVQRVDMNVLKKELPPKTVFVIAVKLSSLQRKLYRRFLDVHGFSGKQSCEGIKNRSFFAGYQTLAQICNHPWILQLMRDREYGKQEDTFENFLPDASSSDENVDSNMWVAEKANAKNDCSLKKDDNIVEGWWNEILTKKKHGDISCSGKMVLLLDILVMSSEIGDKALVFSQSLAALDLMESYLSHLPRPGKDNKNWKKGKDWYRIDGKTEGSERQKLVDRFNNLQNTKVKCILISTKAGALGINLYSANRVIIFDGSWNPTHDLQAIDRAWRYGQTKPVYAYRLVAQGTMEEKIYKRQVQKEGLAARVVDRQQIHRNLSREDILHFFDFGDDGSTNTLSESTETNGRATDSCINANRDLLKKKLGDCPSNCTSDKLMENLLGRHRLRWITNYHEHETLLQENEEEKLTEEQKDRVWNLHTQGVKWQEVHRVPADETKFEQEITSKPTPFMEQTSKPVLTEQSINNPDTAFSVYSRVPIRRCTNKAHLLTLRSQGIKPGCSTVCGECAQEISWENLNSDSKSKS